MKPTDRNAPHHSVGEEPVALPSEGWASMTPPASAEAVETGMETPGYMASGRCRRWGWVFPVMAAIGAVLGLGVGAVVTYFQPKVYETSARLEVRKGSEEPLKSPLDLIRSDQVLGLAVDRLNLAQLWDCNRSEAIRSLGGLVKAKFLSGTDLLIITVRHPDRELVAKLADGVAVGFRKCWEEHDRRIVELQVQELRKAVRAQEDVVDKRRKEFAGIIRRTGILYTGWDESDADDWRRMREEGLKSKDYLEAKQVFETEFEKLQEQKIKLIAEEISSKMMDDSNLIHGGATVPERPVSPNAVLNLLSATVLGLLGFSVLARPVMVRLRRLFPTQPAASMT